MLLILMIFIYVKTSDPCFLFLTTTAIKDVMSSTSLPQAYVPFSDNDVDENGVAIDTSVIPSPSRKYLQKVTDWEYSEWFIEFHDEADSHGNVVKYVRWKTEGAYEANVSAKDLRSLIMMELNDDGSLKKIDWSKSNNERNAVSNFFRSALRDETPPMMALRFENSRSAMLYKRKREKKFKHSFQIYITGHCAAKDRHGCGTKFVAGFTLEELNCLTNLTYEGPVTMGLLVFGNCLHLKNGPRYGDLRGRDRTDVLTHYSSRDASIASTAQPRNIFKDQVSKMSDVALLSQNFDGSVATKHVAYKIKKELARSVEEFYNFKSTNDLVNMTTADRRIVELDIELRRTLRDKSIDYPGNLRFFEIKSYASENIGGKLKTSSSVSAALLTKTSAILAQACCVTGKAVLHYDGTGYPGKLPMDKISDEVTQINILSINSDVIIKGGEKNKIRARLANKVIGQFISNRNTEEDHVKFLRLLPEMQMSIFGRVFPPLAFSTDAALQLPSAALKVWNNGKTMLNLIQYSNICLITLLEVEILLGTDDYLDSLRDESGDLVRSNGEDAGENDESLTSKRKRSSDNHQVLEVPSKRMKLSTGEGKSISVGMADLVLPSKRKSKVKRVPTTDGERKPSHKSNKKASKKEVEQIIAMAQSDMPNVFDLVDDKKGEKKLPHRERDVWESSLKCLQQYAPTLPMICKTHVNRAVESWITSSDRKENVKAYASQCSILLQYLIVNGTEGWDLSRLLVQIGLLIYIFSLESIPFDGSVSSSHIESHTNVTKLEKRKRKLKEFVRGQTRWIYKFIGGHAARRKKMLEVSDGEQSIQTYMARSIVRRVVDNARAIALPLFTTYVSSVEKNEATVSTTIVYGYGDKVTASGEIETDAPLCVGGFIQVIQRHDKYRTVIKNPIHCSQVSAYLDKTWCGRSPMWCGHLVRLAKHGADAALHDNNQHSEAIIRTLKTCEKFNSHKHSLPTYLCYHWDDDLKTNRVFSTTIRQLQTLPKSTWNKSDKKEFVLDKSPDFLELEQVNRMDVQWNRGKVDEDSLRCALQQAFNERKVPVKQRSRQHKCLLQHAEIMKKRQSMRFRNDSLLCNSLYTAWMNNKRSTDKPLSVFTVAVMQSFITTTRQDLQAIGKLVASETLVAESMEKRVTRSSSKATLSNVLLPKEEVDSKRQGKLEEYAV